MAGSHYQSALSGSGLSCASDGPEFVQPLPKHWHLADNLNLTLRQLNSTIGRAVQPTISYVLTSVSLNAVDGSFEQRGSAPNLQGGVLTLCTCKHKMRASVSTSDWPGRWIAGFTSRSIHDGRHWLFYLAKVESAHESHSDVWNSLPERVQRAKAAHVNYLGDVYAPERPSNQPASIPFAPPSGWYAVSAHFVHGGIGKMYDETGNRIPGGGSRFRYFERFEPVDSAGYSILIYRIEN